MALYKFYSYSYQFEWTTATTAKLAYVNLRLDFDAQKPDLQP